MKVPVDGAVIRWQIIGALLQYANERERLAFEISLILSGGATSQRFTLHRLVRDSN